MERISIKDIKDKKTFKRIGYTYTQVLADDENHVYLYKMEKKGMIDCYHYELVKGKKHKNPDGTIVYMYPGDEDFGTYGWFILGNEKYATEKICEKWLSLTGRIPIFSL